MSDRPDGETDGGVALRAERRPPRSERWGRERLRWIGTVAGGEYRLSVRNRWAFALVGVFAVFSLVVAGAEVSRVGPVRVDAVVLSLAGLSTYLLPLAGIAFGYDAVVGADEAGWLDVLFALPADRSAIVVGTYLGRALAFAAAALVGFAPAGALLVVLAGAGAAATYAVFVFAATALGLAFLALGVLVSARAAERTHALGLGLGLWVWFVFAHDLLAVGTLATFELTSTAVTAAVLANPADVFRVLLFVATGTTGGGAGAVFAGAGLSVPAAFAALVAWAALPLLLAGRVVRRRSV